MHDQVSMFPIQNYKLKLTKLLLGSIIFLSNNFNCTFAYRQRHSEIPRSQSYHQSLLRVEYSNASYQKIKRRKRSTEKHRYPYKVGSSGPRTQFPRRLSKNPNRRSTGRAAGYPRLIRHIVQIEYEELSADGIGEWVSLVARLNVPCLSPPVVRKRNKTDTLLIVLRNPEERRKKGGKGWRGGGEWSALRGRKRSGGNWLPRRSVPCLVALRVPRTIARPCHVSCGTMILVAPAPIPGRSSDGNAASVSQDNARGESRHAVASTDPPLLQPRALVATAHHVSRVTPSSPIETGWWYSYGQDTVGLSLA